MEDDNSATEMFASFTDYLARDQEVREEIRTKVKDVETKSREILTIVQGIHQPRGLKEVGSICEKARAKFSDIREGFAELAKLIPSDQFYRFHDHWRFVTQRLCFIGALIVYLENERLIGREECATLLGCKVERTAGFHVDLDDFLMGLLQLASELSRWSVNVVTAGDYGRPLRISKFMCELDAGFRLLNLKNDSLRKRFDGLKYDLKKVEEVVYDVSIRGLTPAGDGGTQPTAT